MSEQELNAEIGSIVREAKASRDRLAALESKLGNAASRSKEAFDDIGHYVRKGQTATKNISAHNIEAALAGLSEKAEILELVKECEHERVRFGELSAKLGKFGASIA